MFVLASLIGVYAVTVVVNALNAGDRVADPDIWNVVPSLIFAALLAAWAVWAFNRARG